MLKAEYKGIKFEAKNHLPHVRDQASDYYLTIFDPIENKAYPLKIDSAYQFD